jgi:hypothetical protein
VRFHAAHFSWLLLRHGEVCIIFGFATGRVSYTPTARWLYSFRLFLGVVRIELLWRTGEHPTIAASNVADRSTP